MKDKSLPTVDFSSIILSICLIRLAFKVTNFSEKALVIANNLSSSEPGSKLLELGMVIQPLIGNPYNGYIKPYYWVDDHPLLYGNNVSLDPSTSGSGSSRDEIAMDAF